METSISERDRFEEMQKEIDHQSSELNQYFIWQYDCINHRAGGLGQSVAVPGNKKLIRSIIETDKENDVVEQLYKLRLPYMKKKDITGLPIIRPGDSRDNRNWEYDFSRIEDTKYLELYQKECFIFDTSYYRFLINKVYLEDAEDRNVKKDRDSISEIKSIWSNFIIKYFIQEKNLIHSIFISLHKNKKKVITVDRERLLEECNNRKQEYKRSKIHDEGEVEEALVKLAKVHPDINIQDGRFQYPESMQNAIIECIAIPYGDVLVETPFRTLNLTIMRVEEDKQNWKEHIKNKGKEATQSKRKLISNWEKNNNDFSFEVFAEANRRLFLENENGIDMETVEYWNSLTGSLIVNGIYKTLLLIDKQYKIIYSRMDDTVLEEIYLCIERLLGMTGFNYLEKAMFIQRMCSLFPLFFQQENETKSERIKVNNEKIKKVVRGLTDAIRDFDVEDWRKRYIKGLEKADLLDNEAFIDEWLRENSRIKTAFVKVYSENQRKKDDLERGKNRIFFQKLTKAVLYLLYS